MSSLPVFCPLPSRTQSSSFAASPRPPYQAPHLLHTYRHLPSREIEHDASPIAYYARAPIGANLNNGFERRTDRDPRLVEHLDGLCEGLIRYARRKGGLKKGALITWRGMLTRLLTAAYNDRDGWEMNAMALDGNVYLEDSVSPEAVERRIAEDQSSAIFSYYGYAFESYSTVKGVPTSSSDRRHLDWTEDMNVDTNEQWCCIAKSKIGQTRLYMGGEVDCVEGQWQDSWMNCVELKTNMLIKDSRGQTNFERKLMKHWAQSMLLGIPNVEVGFRDNRGIIQQIQRFETMRIPRMSSNETNPLWTSQHCLETFAVLAAFILQNVLPSDPIPGWQEADIGSRLQLPPPVIWQISFEPKKGITMRVKEDECKGDDGRWGFLPLDYVQELVDAP